jgi:hypothetical protein
MNEDFRFALDWDLVLRFLDAKAKFIRLPRFLGAFRVHAAQKTSAELAELGTWEMEKLREKAHGRPVCHHETAKAVRGYRIRSELLRRLYRFGLIKYSG